MELIEQGNGLLMTVSPSRYWGVRAARTHPAACAVHSIGLEHFQGQEDSQELLENLLSPYPYIPHGHCYLWQTPLVGLHLVSDALIAIAYFSIPAMLIYFVRKGSNLPNSYVFVLFGAFMIICGTGYIRTAELVAANNETEIQERIAVETAMRLMAKREKAIARLMLRMRQSLNLELIFHATTAELRQAIACDRVLIYRFNPDWSGALVSESVVDGWDVLLPERANSKVKRSTTDFCCWSYRTAIHHI